MQLRLRRWTLTGTFGLAMLGLGYLSRDRQPSGEMASGIREAAPQHDEAAPLNPARLQARLNNESGSQFLVLTSIVKGVALGAGVQSFLALLDARAAHHSTPSIFFVMLAVTSLELILTYWATVSGVTLIQRPADFLDAALPTMLAVAEFVQFASLSPARGFDRVATWLVMTAVSSGLAVAIVVHVNRRILRSQYDDLTNVVDLLKRGLKWDAFFASLACTAASISAALRLSGHLNGTNVEVSIYASLTGVTVGLGGVVRRRRQLVAAISEASASWANSA